MYCRIKPSVDIPWEIKRKIPSSQLASYIFIEHWGDETELNPAFGVSYWKGIARIMLVHAEKHCRICEGWMSVLCQCRHPPLSGHRSALLLAIRFINWLPNWMKLASIYPSMCYIQEVGREIFSWQNIFLSTDLILCAWKFSEAWNITPGLRKKWINGWNYVTTCKIHS